MTAADLAGWRAFYAVEPWGCREEDRRAAITAALVANIFRDAKANSTPFTTEDFTPKRQLRTVVDGRAIEKAPKPAQFLRVIDAMNLALGAQMKRDRRPRYE